MKLSSYTTIEQIDQRLVWLNKEIEIAKDKAFDRDNPNADKAKSRVKNLKYEKGRLLIKRCDLQTPAFL